MIFGRMHEKMKETQRQGERENYLSPFDEQFCLNFLPYAQSTF